MMRKMKLSAGARAALILLIKPMTQEIEKEEVGTEVKLEDKIKQPGLLQKSLLLNHQLLKHLLLH